MHGLAAIVGVFGGSLWDLSQNHGAWSRAVGVFVTPILRCLGFQ